jgi:hypothetical protein
VDSPEIEQFLIEQNADRDAWYVDMRGAAVSFGERQTLESLQESLLHCRNYLEEKKREWVEALLFSGKASSSALTFTVYGDMQLVRAQLERCKSLIIAANGRPATNEFDGERPRSAVQRLSDIVRKNRDIETVGRSLYDAFHAMSWTYRGSYIGVNHVLILKNHSDYTLHFALCCIARNGYTKDIDVSIAPHDSEEIGKDQGWDSHWVDGEEFEVWHKKVRIWRATF